MNDKFFQAEASSELFPCVFKDVESGVYLAESKVPTSQSIGHVQLVVDNNVLGALNESPQMFKRLAWTLGQNSTPTGSVVSINPFWAVAEQYLSNPDNAFSKIDAFAKHPGTMGTFAPGYANSILETVRTNESILREQIGKLICYFFVMKELYHSKLTLHQRADRWLEFYKNDIPRLMVPYILGQLFFFGKDDSAMRFKSTGRKVQDWAQGFLAIRSKERGNPARWIRNRLFDILPFQLLPTMNWTAHGGIQSRLFVLSQDADVGECFFRIFSWKGDQVQNTLWNLHTNFSCLNFPAYAEFQQMAIGKLEPRHVTEDSEKLERLRRLVDVSIQLLSPVNQQDMLSALNEFQFFELLSHYESK